MSPIDRSPEARARALERCREVDEKHAAHLGGDGLQRLEEIREQNAKFVRQDKFIDRKHLQRQRKREVQDES